MKSRQPSLAGLLGGTAVECCFLAGSIVCLETCLVYTLRGQFVATYILFLVMLCIILFSWVSIAQDLIHDRRKFWTSFIRNRCQICRSDSSFSEPRERLVF